MWIVLKGYRQFIVKQESSRKSSAWKDLRFKHLSFQFPPEGLAN